MRVIPLAAIVLSSFAAPSLAALPGFYDSFTQIEKIFNDGEIAKRLNYYPIRSIENTGSSDSGAKEWTVRTMECDLIVYLKPVPFPPGYVGKVQYSVESIGDCD